MASNFFRQVIRFCVDAYGLERLLRLFQSILHIVASFQALRSIVACLSSGDQLSETQVKAEDDLEATSRALITVLALKGQLGLTRRFFRSFRFLDAFNSTYTLVAARKAGPMPLVMSLDLTARTFNGLYLLLETLTLVDAMKIEGLTIFTPEYENLLKLESQRSWFLALIAGGMRCAVILYQDQAERASIEAYCKDASPGLDEVEEKPDGSPESYTRRLSCSRQEKMHKRVEELDRRRLALTRKLTANCLDLTLPGSVIGWVPVSSGAVGFCMFLTTLLTGWDVWERCGREVSCIS